MKSMDVKSSHSKSLSRRNIRQYKTNQALFIDSSSQKMSHALFVIVKHQFLSYPSDSFSKLTCRSF